MKIKKAFTYSFGIIGDLVFLYGLLAHGSLQGQIFETLGIVMMGISIILIAKMEEKACHMKKKKQS